MQAYPEYDQSYYQEQDYSNKSEFQFKGANLGADLMKAERCPTPPGQGYQQGFDKASHGYAAGNTHTLDKYGQGGGYGSQDYGFDKTTHGYGGHDQSFDKFNQGGYGGYEQNFDKVSHGYDGNFDKMTHSQQNFDTATHGYGGNGHNFDKMSHGQQSFDKVTHGYGGNGHNFDKMTHVQQDFDKVTHGYGGNGHNFDKMSHGQPKSKLGHGSFTAGINLSFDKFRKPGGGHNAHQQQGGHFNSGNDFYGQGGNHHGAHGYGNKFGSDMTPSYGQNGGYGGHHGSPPMPMRGHSPVAPVQKGVTPTWNFKGISDF